MDDNYDEGKFQKLGTPSIEYFSERIHLSANYLSDSDSVSGIAYKLGFNYPHCFSRLFKGKTGMTPQE